MDLLVIIIGIISFGIVCVLGCLGTIIWILRQLITKPQAQAAHEAQQVIKTEVEVAKVILDAHVVQTRLEPQTTVSESQTDLEKLRDLRRKK